MNALLWLARKIKRRFSDPMQRWRKAGVVIGERVNILGEVIIDPTHGWHIEIGDDVTLAPRVHILAHDASTKIFLDCTRIGRVRIGNRVFIGASSIVLPGVYIGDDVIIGARSVVTADIPSGSVAAGNPARVICPIQDFLEKRKMEARKYPRFGVEYTEKYVTTAMKIEMNRTMKDRFGFID
jgi:maltose O-acetyltransferase